MTALSSAVSAGFEEAARELEPTAAAANGAAPHGPLQVVPCTLKRAFEFVRTNHRHHRPPVGGLFAVGVERDGELRGVAIAGRPVSRMLDDGGTIEVTRVATDGSRNACSILYGALWRAARALGYRRAVTYTLPSEGGVSLRASGWTCTGEAGGGSWSRSARPRNDDHPTEIKLRWQVGVANDNCSNPRKEG